MTQYVGLDVSMKETNFHVLDEDTGAAPSFCGPENRRTDGQMQALEQCRDGT